MWLELLVARVTVRADGCGVNYLVGGAADTGPPGRPSTRVVCSIDGAVAGYSFASTAAPRAFV
ncbi:MAG TPA: hypothetical protein VFN41_13940, partial [Candidatus Limnocylindrales bacterium]|nr:hypothetical protein [Candidatus Limnocylindrales bacterium]